MLQTPRSPRKQHFGFTLIELLVVVAIIAVLISILLPSLSRARAQARATVCASNLASVGKAMAVYLAESDGTFPYSYAYPARANEQRVDLSRQGPVKGRTGYIHWSYFMYESGKVDDLAFQCPTMENGGHPRTNPGFDAVNWINGQTDDSNAKNSDQASVEDFQAPFLAYTGNAAVMPRNKFGRRPLGLGSTRQNRFVRDGQVVGPRRVVLATEFMNRLSMVSDDLGRSDGGDTGNLVKAHRSIHAFQSPGQDGRQNWEVDLPSNSPTILYYRRTTNTEDPERAYGILNKTKAETTNKLVIFNESGTSQLNMVGRHHPGGGDYVGGTANFLYVDGGVTRTTMLQTAIDREWGDEFWSLTGNNSVDIQTD